MKGKMTLSLIFIILVLLLFTTGFTETVSAQQYHDAYGLFSIGHEGDYWSFAGEIAQAGKIGFGASIVYNQDYTSDDIIDSRMPYRVSEELGEKNVDSDFGIYFTFPRRIGDGSIIVSPGIGGYFSRKWELVRGRWGRLYKQEGETEFGLDLSLSFIYDSKRGYYLGAGYSNFRGTNISIGFSF